MRNPSLLTTLMLLTVLATPACADSLKCPDNIKKLPRLVADQGVVEPSGVAWDPGSQWAIGVSDESSPHALFAFDPKAIRPDNTIRALPLLTPAQVKQFNPDDLEGITRLPGGEFVATASLGLHKGKPRDTLLRFALKPNGAQAPGIDTPRKISPAGGLNGWLTTTANPPWDKKISALDGETGINVEGLATSREGLLVFGFRNPELAGKPVVLVAREEANGALSVVQWRKLKLQARFQEGGILGIGKEPLGVRDMALIPGAGGNAWLVLLGASGSGSDLPFQLGIWNDDQDEIRFVGTLPLGFRAEGITVLDRNQDTLRLLLVSDKKGLVMTCEAVIKNR
ncbi:hypothetical protein SIID45300_01306 [Candidatus Magnetaquicoccaceae bacterium FCR-1]|uniref:Phytase-like domain-containing protein n=1 Tax=Candidatus Magnetaquiglobus chichijimensis TaxID=3141448 RepID=A0ABQ0C7X6_9PROT